jgi:hypothetical protein
MKLTVGRVVFGGDNWVNYYDLPWGTMVGMNYLLESGVPRSTLASQKNINLFPNGRGHLAGRLRFSPAIFCYSSMSGCRARCACRWASTPSTSSIRRSRLPSLGRPTAISFNVDDATFFGLQSVSRGVGFELQARCAFREGQRLPGRAGGAVTGEVDVLSRVLLTTGPRRSPDRPVLHCACLGRRGSLDVPARRRESLGVKSRAARFGSRSH